MEFVQELPIPFPVTFCGDKESPNVLLLHGFLQTASGFYKKTQSAFSQSQRCVAIQAPFPVFRQRTGRYDVGYSWFFYDAASDTYLVTRDFGIQYCLEAIKRMGWKDSITQVVGYSQGGYVAPFLANHLPSVQQVTGVHCRFRHEDLGKPLGYTLNQIHGDDDQVVDPVKSKNSHSIIMEAGNRGQFYLLPETGHEISESVIDTLKGVLIS